MTVAVIKYLQKYKEITRRFCQPNNYALSISCGVPLKSQCQPPVNIAFDIPTVHTSFVLQNL